MGWSQFGIQGGNIPGCIPVVLTDHEEPQYSFVNAVRGMGFLSQRARRFTERKESDPWSFWTYSFCTSFGTRASGLHLEAVWGSGGKRIKNVKNALKISWGMERNGLFSSSHRSTLFMAHKRTDMVSEKTAEGKRWSRYFFDVHAQGGGARAVNKGFVFQLAVWLASGVLVVVGWAWWANEKYKSDLLIQTRLIANAVNVEEVKTLSGTPEQLNNPIHYELVRKLTEIQSVMPEWRWIYILLQRADGVIVAGLDTDPPESEYYSIPGEVYDDPPVEFFQAFAEKRTGVFGPYGDEWGEWLTAAVPIVDPETDRVVGVYAVDIEAARWILTVASKAFLPMGVFALLGIILVTRRRAMMVRGHRQEELQDRESRATRQRTAIAHLALEDSIVRGDMARALKKITGVLSATVSASRTSIWKLSEDGHALNCISLYESGEHLASRDSMVDMGKFPRYFETLMAESRIHAEEAQTDPRSSELTDYFKEHGIVSILDAGIIVDGRLVGVVSLEQAGRRAQWHADEESFVSTIAAIVGQLFANVERKKAEDALKESETRFRHIAEMLPSGIFEIDLNGRVFFANKTALDMFGYTPEDIESGMIAFDALASTDRVLAKERVFLRLNGEAIGYQEYVGQRMDGTTFPVSFNIAPKIVGEQVTGFLGAMMDLTERKRAEEQLRQINHQLEAAIVEANAMTMAAKAASVAKSSFLANMSHEFRTPLNAIIGFAQVLRHDDSLSPRQLEQLHSIARSGEHLLGLINTILDMSKIEAGKLLLNERRFCLHEMLNDLEKMFCFRVESKGVRIVVERQESVPHTVMADEGKLRQVLINLMENAVKFTKAGDVVLRIWAEFPEAETGRCCLRVEVQDSGTGIPEGEQERIFEPFEQTESGRKMGGTGLGLPISRKLVEMMGGEISVDSREGKGSCFRFHVCLKVVSREGSAPVPGGGDRMAGGSLSRGELGPLPDEVAQAMRKALDAGDVEELEKQISLLVQVNPDAGRRLGVLLKQYDYDQIRRVLNKEGA